MDVKCSPRRVGRRSGLGLKFGRTDCEISELEAYFNGGEERWVYLAMREVREERISNLRERERKRASKSRWVLVKVKKKGFCGQTIHIYLYLYIIVKLPLISPLL